MVSSPLLACWYVTFALWLTVLVFWIRSLRRYNKAYREYEQARRECEKANCQPSDHLHFLQQRLYAATQGRNVVLKALHRLHLVAGYPNVDSRSSQVALESGGRLIHGVMRQANDPSSPTAGLKDSR